MRKVAHGSACLVTIRRAYSRCASRAALSTVHQRHGKPGKVPRVVQGAGGLGELPVEHADDLVVVAPQEIPRPEITVLHCLPWSRGTCCELPPRIRGAGVSRQAGPQPAGQPAQPFRAFVGLQRGERRRTLIPPLDIRQDLPAG